MIFSSLMLALGVLHLTGSSHAIKSKTIYCDVIVAGGSTAALAAAISSARRSPDLHVCLTEPTDWLGGQLTSAGVPAIDFGKLNRESRYQASDFVAMLESLGTGNPGQCWVSTKCYLPKDLLDKWITKTVSSYTNLTVLFNTVVKKVIKDGRNIVGLKVIQRTVLPGVSEWKLRYSESIVDWYSMYDSEYFNKSKITLLPRTTQYPAVIDATELGDVLVLSGASFRQGVEAPLETSEETMDTCGQAFTFPFYTKLHNHTVPKERWPTNPSSV